MLHTPETFTDSIESFVTASDWLTPEDAPAVLTLRKLAAELDSGPMVPALVAQWGLTYRSLLKRKPTGDFVEDPLEAALRDAGV